MHLGLFWVIKREVISCYHEASIVQLRNSQFFLGIRTFWETIAITKYLQCIQCADLKKFNDNVIVADLVCLS